MSNKMNIVKIIKNNEEILVTESRDVAKMINVEHNELLKKIKGYENILNSPKSKFTSGILFSESSYCDSNGQFRKCYYLTRKGCDMIANKLTGEKGVLFTAEYVTKFEEMEQQLNQKLQSSLPKDYISALKLLVKSEEEKLIMEPKADYYDKLIATEFLTGIRETAKECE